MRCLLCGQMMGTTHRCPTNPIKNLGKYAKIGAISWNKGKRGIYSEETLKRMSESAIRVGKGHHFLGKPKSLESRIKMSIAHKKLVGDKHPGWRGGISKIYSIYNNNRRALLLKAKGSYTAEEWLKLKEKYNSTCIACGRKEPDIKISQDHIVPLKKGGSNSIDNIQPLCRSCNSKKHTKIINYFNNCIL